MKNLLKRLGQNVRLYLMCDENTSKSLNHPNPGYAQDASSPIMGGTRNVRIGDVNPPGQYKDPIGTTAHERNKYADEIYGNMGRTRNGSPIFYAILEQMARTHDKKSHDYASNDNPFENYHFAGMMSQLFKNPDDAGFIGRIGEKLFRLSNLENSQKIALNETVEDTENDLCVIMALWVADRRTRRMRMNARSTTLPGDITSAQAKRSPMPRHNQD